MAEKSVKTGVIREYLSERVAAFGVDLIDVVRVRENGRTILRLIIDRRGGVAIDDCVAVSEMADPLLEQELGVTDHDFFEVSSAGLERPLKATSDLVRHEGADVDVRLYRAEDGIKVFSGVLGPADDEQLTLILEDGLERVFERQLIASVRRRI